MAAEYDPGAEQDTERLREIERYLLLALDGFVGDPPDSDFQSGYLAALKAVATEGLGLVLPRDVARIEEPRGKPVLRLV